MATGRQPFREETPKATMEAILTKSPAPPRSLNPAVPLQLEKAIVKALEKAADQRYRRASDLAADLEQLRRSMEPALSVAALDGSCSPFRSTSGNLSRLDCQPVGGSQVSTKECGSPSSCKPRLTTG